MDVAPDLWVETKEGNLVRFCNLRTQEFSWVRPDNAVIIDIDQTNPNAIREVIKQLDVSYVIRKYLDSNRIENLAKYLEDLLKKNLANKYHIMLLLNCYIKLKNGETLRSLIDQIISSPTLLKEFDALSAIPILKKHRYFDEALKLCKQIREHDLYLDILQEKSPSVKELISYMRTEIPEDLCPNYVKIYGRRMMEDDEGVELIKNAFFKVSMDKDSKENMALKSALMSILMSGDKNKIDYLKCLGSSGTDILLEIYLNKWQQVTDPQVKASLEEAMLAEIRKNECDLMKALIIMKFSKFEEGVLCIYEMKKQYDLMLFHYMDRNDKENILKICRNYDNYDSSLWVKAFNYFAKNGTGVGENALEEILSKIKEKKLMQPISVVDSLSEAKIFRLGEIRDYLVDHLTQHLKILKENEALINKENNEIAKIKAKIQTLNSPQEFRPQLCSACKLILDTQTVNFLCGHSYHPLCYNGEPYCRTCLLKSQQK